MGTVDIPERLTEQHVGRRGSLTHSNLPFVPTCLTFPISPYNACQQCKTVLKQYSRRTFSRFGGAGMCHMCFDPPTTVGSTQVYQALAGFFKNKAGLRKSFFSLDSTRWEYNSSSNINLLSQWNLLVQPKYWTSHQGALSRLLGECIPQADIQDLMSASRTTGRQALATFIRAMQPERAHWSLFYHRIILLLLISSTTLHFHSYRN